jgi:hypothetical protein
MQQVRNAFDDVACSMRQSLADGEEATEAAHSGKDGSQSTAEANLEALASSLGDRKAGAGHYDTSHLNLSPFCL